MLAVSWLTSIKFVLIQRRQISSWILMYQIIHMYSKTQKSLNPLSVLYGWNLCSLLFFTTSSLMTDGKAQTTKLAGRLSWKPLFDDRNFQDYIDHTKFLFFKNKTINLASLCFWFRKKLEPGASTFLENFEFKVALFCQAIIIFFSSKTNALKFAWSRFFYQVSNCFGSWVKMLCPEKRINGKPFNNDMYWFIPWNQNTNFISILVKDDFKIKKLFFIFRRIFSWVLARKDSEEK